MSSFNIEKIVQIFCLYVLIFSNLSFRWPLNGGQLTSTYGESRTDHFHDGVDMVAFETKTYPIAKGKLVYAWNKSLFPLDNYPGAGNYLVLEHENQKSSIYSVYFHLDDSEYLSESYGENDVIGDFANTGRSYGAHTHFGIIDPQNWSSINAIKLLPKIEDKQPPVVGNFAIKIDDKYTILRDKSAIRLTKHYPLLVKIIDTIKGGERLGIYNLTVKFEEKEILNITFDKMLYAKKKLTFNGNSYLDLYDESGYYKIKGFKYKQGENIWTIIAKDYAGNTTTKRFTLDINLDM